METAPYGDAETKKTKGTWARFSSLILPIPAKKTRASALRRSFVFSVAAPKGCLNRGSLAMSNVGYSYTDIERATCGAFGITKADLQSRKRSFVYSRPRIALSYLARRFTTLSTPQLGDRLHRDHTTILHHERRAVVLIKENPSFREGMAAALWRLRHTPRSREEILKAVMSDDRLAPPALPSLAETWC